MTKMKMRIFCLIIGLYLLSLSLYAGDLGSVDGHAVVFEKGDAIYRRGYMPNFITYYYGHAGIFYGWPITEADSHDSSQYATIEALGPGDPVSKTNIAKFLSDGPEFWGVRTANLTRFQRTRIAETAKNQIGFKYRALRGYKRPGGGILDFQSFRCDGLVEYCYESVGVDLVPGDTSNPVVASFPGRVFMTPLNQMNSPLLSERTSASVETVELEKVLQHGEEIEPEGDVYYVYYRPNVPDKVTIEVNVSDGDYGSGIRMTDFWVGAPDDTPDTFESNDSGKRIGIDKHTTAVGGIYKADWNIDNFDTGGYTLHILAYDQAGNIGTAEIQFFYKKILPVIRPLSARWYRRATVTSFDTLIEAYNAAREQLNFFGWKYDSNYPDWHYALGREYEGKYGYTIHLSRRAASIHPGDYMTESEFARLKQVRIRHNIMLYYPCKCSSMKKQIVPGGEKTEVIVGWTEYIIPKSAITYPNWHFHVEDPIPEYGEMLTETGCGVITGPQGGLEIIYEFR